MRTAERWETPASRVCGNWILTNQSFIGRALEVHRVLCHYLFNMSDLNPSQKLIAQALSSWYFYLPTTTVYLHQDTQKRPQMQFGVIWVCLGSSRAGSREADMTRATGNTWRNTAQETRQLHGTNLTQLRKHPLESEGSQGSEEFVPKICDPCLSPLKHTSIRFGDLRR